MLFIPLSETSSISLIKECPLDPPTQTFITLAEFYLIFIFLTLFSLCEPTGLTDHDRCKKRILNAIKKKETSRLNFVTRLGLARREINMF